MLKFWVPHLPRLIFVCIKGLQLTTTEIFTMYQGESLLCANLHPITESNFLSISFLYQENRSLPYKMSPHASLQQLILIISGKIEINPGPGGKPKFLVVNVQGCEELRKVHCL